MNQKAFQDQFPDEYSHCYGCGRLNEHGWHIKSYWDGDESVCHFKPEDYHTAFPGFVYGGLLAAVIDCHSVCTAAASVCRAQGIEIGSVPATLFVTSSLHVEYIKPTPIDRPLELRSTIKQQSGRKIIVTTTVYSGDLACVTGEVVAVQVPESKKIF